LAQRAVATTLNFFSTGTAGLVLRSFCARIRLNDNGVVAVWSVCVPRSGSAFGDLGEEEDFDAIVLFLPGGFQA
jgi:hypothetical protein